MFPTTANSAKNLAAQLTESKIESSGVQAGKAFLKFDFKSGDFSFGRDGDDVTGETLVVNTYSIQHGWTLWVNGAPQKVSVPFTEYLPDPMPPQAGNEPTESRSFEARFLDDEETIVVFDTNSYGGRRGVDTLLNAIKSRALNGDSEYLFPKIELTSDSYKAKQGGTVYNPVFNIVGWLNAEGQEFTDTPKVEHKEEEAAPVTRRRRRA